MGNSRGNKQTTIATNEDRDEWLKSKRKTRINGIPYSEVLPFQEGVSSAVFNAPKRPNKKIANCSSWAYH